MITIPDAVQQEMVRHCLKVYPLEGCGLLAARPGTAEVQRCLPVPNVADSSRIYLIDPKALLNADREADDHGLEIMAVFHSHTHTAAYPSPTDVAQAPLAEWHYVLVSFANEQPDVRSYRIADGNIEEEPIVSP